MEDAFVHTPLEPSAQYRKEGKKGEVERKREREVGGEDLLMNTHQVSPSSIPLSPVSEVCGVFSDKDLASTTGKQPRAMTYVVWGLFGLS